MSGILALALMAAAQAAPPSACSAAATRQFDFWVGEWAVTDRVTGQPAGSSHIEKIYGGCVLRENYSAGGFRGGSLNAYWSNDRKWHQAWMDSAGAFRHFVGGLDGAGRMVMTAEQQHPARAGEQRLLRLTFTPQSDGTVRQYSDYSDDGGTIWKLRYDFLYRPIH